MHAQKQRRGAVQGYISHVLLFDVILPLLGFFLITHTLPPVELNSLPSSDAET